MNGSLARFRELKGIGAATEARLHEAGIYTWEALAEAARALAAVRSDGDTLRDVANLVAERQGDVGDPASPRRQGTERLEAFVLRVALNGDGEPRRCTGTHVRSMAESVWAGWTPGEVTRFVEEHAGIRHAPESAEHVVVLDAGTAIGGVIGGGARDLDLVITGTGTAVVGFRYRATLAARRLGATGNGGWTPLATSAGMGSPTDDVVLRFPGVRVPPGVQRLRLRLDLTLAATAASPPTLALADVAGSSARDAVS